MGENLDLFGAPLRWERLSPPGRKSDATWFHGSGWLVQHCGHPTANTPYQVRDPSAPERLIVSSSGRGFRSAALARQAVDGVLAGALVVCEGPAAVRFGRVWRIVPPSEVEALTRARFELDGPVMWCGAEARGDVR